MTKSDTCFINIEQLHTAPYYLLSDKRAHEIKEQVIAAVSIWRKVAAKYHGIKSLSSVVSRKYFPISAL